MNSYSRVPSEAGCSSRGRAGVECKERLMGSEDEDSSILTKYEVEINLHYIVHVIIKLNNSVTGKILNRLISVKCSR